jgi:hypothetical protein
MSSHGEADESKNGDMDDTRDDESNVDEEDQDSESRAKGNTYAKQVAYLEPRSK